MLDLGTLRAMSAAELVQYARAANVENPSSLKKPDLVAAILRAHNAGQQSTEGRGVIEILADGFGFLRAGEYSFLTGPDDVYVSPSQIRKFNLRTGDMVAGTVRAPKENERYFALTKVGTVNGEDPESARDAVLFESLTAVHPTRALLLGGSSAAADAADDRTARAIDLCAPLGRGQRVLVEGPARSGKSTVLRSVARGLSAFHPDVHVMMVLVAERPEDVTEIEQSLSVEVLATTFDEPDARHVQVAEMAVERARRLVEHKRDVVVLLDSLNKLVQATHATVPASSRLIAGYDAVAVQRVRRLLGAGRALLEGGSLTMVATLQTDEALVRAFHGTENAGIVLDGDAALAGLFPAFDPVLSRTHRAELLIDADARRARLKDVRDVEGLLRLLGP
ncbi:MAG: transcription termination factor Rho [Myxococcales bacterium]|nr:transcription termination factor Rho [Myxococcales bacterium]